MGENPNLNLSNIDSEESNQSMHSTVPYPTIIYHQGLWGNRLLGLSGVFVGGGGARKELNGIRRTMQRELAGMAQAISGGDGIYFKYMSCVNLVMCVIRPS